MLVVARMIRTIIEKLENRVKIKYLVVGYMKRCIKCLENVINTINWIQFKLDLQKINKSINNILSFLQDNNKLFSFVSS